MEGNNKGLIRSEDAAGTSELFIDYSSRAKCNDRRTQKYLNGEKNEGEEYTRIIRSRGVKIIQQQHI